jgi:tetratricopeptide (TPR) repeat protein
LASKIRITFLLAGDFQSHEQLCRRLFNHLEEFPNPGMGGPVLTAYLAREASVANELGQSAAKCEQAFKHDSAGNNAEWASLIRAMAAYRSARYQEAIEESKAAEKSKELAPRGAAQIFSAMALGKLGRVDEGKQELRQAEAHLGQHLANMTGDSWWDLGLCQLALDEAHRLFDGYSKPRP